MKKARAIKLWQSPILEFLCCTCYNGRSRAGKSIKKVLFMGLDDTGKTTIIKILKNKSIGNIFDTLPSRGLSIEKFELPHQEFYIWDLAGTFKYRLRWINNINYFLSLNELIYFIDIQDKSNYTNSISYLTKILHIINSKLSNSKYKLFILLHKSDPEIIKSRDFGKNFDFLINNIHDLNINYDYEILRTNIYTQSKDFSELSQNVNPICFGTIIKRIFAS